MEDEADRLRRESRARQVDPSIRPSDYAAMPDVEPTGDDGDTNLNGTAIKGKKKHTSNIIDTTLQIPVEESPMIARNKALRQDAMAAIRSANVPGQDEDRGRSSKLGRDSSEKQGQGHRRKSSVSRGKRISASFEVSGSFAEPHKSVTHKSFYKHIDVDLPESERLRQLLIWCHSRTVQDPFTFASSDSSPELPDLSATAHLVLKDVWRISLQRLADKQINLNPYSSSMSSSKRAASMPKLQENEQNMSLRRWETEYSADIRKMEEESEAWNKVEVFYDVFIKKERARVDQRKTDLEVLSHLSAKAQGKQKADAQEMVDDDLSWLPSLDLLPESQRSVLGLCKSLLGIEAARGREDRAIDSGAAARSEKDQAEEKLTGRFRELEYNLDQLHSFVNTARAATRVAENLLDKRFEVLSVALKARTGDSSLFSSSSFSRAPSSAAQVLKEYLPPDPSRTRSQKNPQEIFKALAHVDSQRPPGKKGDEVRRAERVLQRIGEAGGGAVGERRLTLPPPGPQTPRKTPGTPRRGHTPGRERTPGGDR
ncbi:hypothetical protein E1B28_006515 [Marasmius oreades]|nr:uncharacterized protein E1B28_006515 [Marasmius oreades]KAG7095816.1 hypothetical protein E1B28_006515 [Marasmius oreades]